MKDEQVSSYRRKLALKFTDRLSELGRRLFRRAAVGIPVEFEWTGQRFGGRCRNISLGGAFIETTVELPLGSVIRLRFAGPHVAADLELDGEVRWHEVGGVGLRFVNPSTRDMASLSNLVR